MEYYCVKKKCKCDKTDCKINYDYNYQELPCPYMKSDECSFFENLSELDGVKIRRQYFNLLINYFIVLGFIPIVYFLSLNTIFNGVGTKFNSFDSFLYVLLVLIILLLPFVLLSIINRLVFGRLICVLTDRGICCNNWCIKYDDIVSLEYKVELSGRRTAHYNYLIIHTKDDAYKLPHAPRYLVRKLKRINPNIQIIGNKSILYV